MFGYRATPNHPMLRKIAVTTLEPAQAMMEKIRAGPRANADITRTNLFHSRCCGFEDTTVYVAAEWLDFTLYRLPNDD